MNFKGKYPHIIEDIERMFKTEKIYLSDFDPLDVEEEEKEEGLKKKVSFLCPASFSIHGVKYYIQTEGVAWIYGKNDFYIELNRDLIDIRTYDNDKTIDRSSDLYDIIRIHTDFFVVSSWEWCVNWYLKFE